MPFENTSIDRPKGFNSDLSPYELAEDTFTQSLNIDNARFRSNRSKGAEAVYASSTLTIQPLFLMPWNDGSNEVWIYADEDDVYKIDSGETETLMTGALGAVGATQWQGDVFNGVAVLNPKGATAPLYSSTASVVTTLANWPAGYLCKSLRPFKNYLVAMNVDRNTGSFDESIVKWSSPADPGSVPGSWDETSASEQAGETVLSDTPGDIVDGLALGDTFIIYKEDSVWGMNFIGGTFIFQFRKLFDDSGLLTQGCVTEFEGKHFVLTRGDAYVHDGTTKRSVMSSRVTKSFFANVDSTYWENTRVVADENNKDIWIYYPTTDTSTGLADKALVWNWESDTWSERDLFEVSYINKGVVQDSTAGTWSSDTDTWDSDTEFWNVGAVSPDSDSLVAADYTNSQFLELNVGTTWDGTSYTTRLERTGLDFGNPSAWKKVNAIYPSMSGAGTVNFFVGYEDPQGGGVAYEGPYPYVIGTDYKVDVRVNARNLAIKIENSTDDIWALSGITVEWKEVGAKR